MLISLEINTRNPLYVQTNGCLYWVHQYPYLIRRPQILLSWYFFLAFSCSFWFWNLGSLQFRCVDLRPKPRDWGEERVSCYSNLIIKKTLEILLNQVHRKHWNSQENTSQYTRRWLCEAEFRDDVQIPGPWCTYKIAAPPECGRDLWMWCN